MPSSPSSNRISKRPKPPVPQLHEASSRALGLESVLSDLLLHEFQLEAHHTGIEIARIFEQYPRLPGAVLLERGQFWGMISRQRLLEFLIRPGGMNLFMPSAVSTLYSYARSQHLLLPAATPILAAAQLALRRPLDQQNEPIIVQIDASTYRLLDIHELNIAYWQIRGIETQVRYERAQTQMVQTEKMASLGRLVDGVAHEILDPVGFIWGNLTHLSAYTAQIMELLSAYERHFPTLPPEIIQLQDEIELSYLRDDLPQTIASIRSGAERLKNLVTSLQNFCHIDDVYPKPADVHECLDSILLLLKSRLSGNIRIVRNYGHLPPVSCYAGQLNQVFMNILTNAVNSLLNQASRQEIAAELPLGQTNPLEQVAEPQITITTQVRSAPNDGKVANPASRWISIQITDNGPGLSEEKYRQILESLSVEKRADKETSLAVSYQIITAKHGGKFYLRPRPSVSAELAESANSATCSISSGMEFEIWLPLV